MVSSGIVSGGSGSWFEQQLTFVLICDLITITLMYFIIKLITYMHCNNYTTY